MSFIVKLCARRHLACVSFSELENDTLNQAELNEMKIDENK
jgi:hypothetical protein